MIKLLLNKRNTLLPQLPPSEPTAARFSMLWFQSINLLIILRHRVSTYGSLAGTTNRCTRTCHTGMTPVVSTVQSAWAKLIDSLLVWSSSLLQTDTERRKYHEFSYRQRIVQTTWKDRALVYFTRAVQPVATCRQSPYLHKPASVIMIIFLAIRRSQPPFSLWRHSHCDVFRYRAGHAHRYGHTRMLRIRTPYRI